MTTWRRALVIGLVFVIVGRNAAMAESAAGNKSMDERAEAFIKAHEKTIRPLDIKVGRAWWDANVSGKDEDFARKEKTQNQLNAALADAKRFAELKAIADGVLSNPLLKRQIDVLYLQYLGKQVDSEILKRITALENKIEKQFNVYRARVGDEELTDSQVRKVLLESKDSARRRAVWEASKRVGAAIAIDLRDLVLLRNDAARKLGFANYHAMQLHLNEQSQEQVLKLFDELDELTREPFAKVKAEIDRTLAKDYGVRPEALRPWHYHDPFFQQPPAIYETDLDAVFKNADILKICREFYSGIGLPIEDVIARSDLYEKPGKSPHAFCTDIDREGDVRVLANIVRNEYWLSTMLHELGHAVYSSKFIPRDVPYVLRSDAHILATEGVAMMFERFSKNADWLKAMGVAVENPQAYNETGAKMRRNQLLIFSRWCQVMLRFEVAMYRNPAQDLNKLWWDLVEKYQLVHRPDGRSAPDYASKIHVVSAPACYHNYMMGELFACQVHGAIAKEVLNADDPATAIYTTDKRVGRFMRDRVFKPGRTLDWNELTKHATGEYLNAQAFADEFAGP